MGWSTSNTEPTLNPSITVVLTFCVKRAAIPLTPPFPENVEGAQRPEALTHKKTHLLNMRIEVERASSSVLALYIFI